MVVLLDDSDVLVETEDGACQQKLVHNFNVFKW